MEKLDFYIEAFSGETTFLFRGFSSTSNQSKLQLEDYQAPKNAK